MRLGTETGSLMNHVMATSAPATAPVPGMGATLLMWTDRHAYTITWVHPNVKMLLATRDIAKCVNNYGMSDYHYTTDHNASHVKFTLRKNGRWYAKGDSMRGNCLAIGYRREYYDHSF